MIGSNSYVTAYGYDAADHITQLTLPSGRIVSFTYNTRNEVASVKMQTNAAAALENVATAVSWRAMSGLLSSFTYGNGLSFVATYDLDNRLATLKVKDGAASLISKAYSYGDGLNLTAIHDGLDAAQDVDLAYTPANRLDVATGPWGSLDYAYDAVGNRTQEVKIQSGVTTTTVLAYQSTSNRIASETVNGAQSRAFSYDAAGNQLSGLPPGASYTLTYDKRNRPNMLKLNGSIVASYRYNGLEQMALRTISAPLYPAGTVHYIYDLEGHLIAEADGATGAISRDYVWLEGMPLAVIDGTATPVTSFVHVDHLMRPIRLTDASKATVWSATWLPWGGAHITSGATAQNLRFPGQYFLIEQGLHYNWRRIYDPTTGRYTQPDPLGFPDGPARYAYAGNMPLMNVDRNGLTWVSTPFGPVYVPDEEPNDGASCPAQQLPKHGKCFFQFFGKIGGRGVCTYHCPESGRQRVVVIGSLGKEFCPREILDVGR